MSKKQEMNEEMVSVWKNRQVKVSFVRNYIIAANTFLPKLCKGNCSLFESST